MDDTTGAILAGGNSEDDPEFTALMERYMDSDLSDDELALLNERLRSDPLARVEFIRGLMQSAYLRVLIEQDRLAASIAGIIDEESSPSHDAVPLADAELEEVIIGAPSISDTAAPRPANSALWGVSPFHSGKGASRLAAPLSYYGKLAASAGGIATLVVLMLFAIPTSLDKATSAKKELPVAPVAAAETVRQRDCEWLVDGRPATPKQIMSGSVVQLKRGEAELEFGKGARVTLVGPVWFQAAAKDRMVLVEGPAIARVPRRASGFIIDTPAMRATDLGTEFGVKSHPDGRSELLVFSGVVEVQLANGSGLRRTLRTGQSISATIQQVNGTLSCDYDEVSTVKPSVFKRSASTKPANSKN